MLVDISVWAWIGLLAMGAGTIAPLWAWYSRPSATGESHARYYATLAGVTGIAALAYLLMALGFGSVSTATGDLDIVRYLDWLLTTPLLILYLGLLARPSRGVLAGLVGVDVVIIAGGIVAAATTGTVSWIAFGVAAVAYLGLVYGLLVSLPRSASAADDRVRAIFGTLRNITVVLWTLYPVDWLLGSTGFGLLTPATEMLVFVYLDIVSKVGFVIVAVAGADALNYLDTGCDTFAVDATDPSAEEQTTVLGDD
jgi:sensory rhodopsin